MFSDHDIFMQFSGLYYRLWRNLSNINTFVRSLFFIHNKVMRNFLILFAVIFTVFFVSCDDCDNDEPLPEVEPLPQVVVDFSASETIIDEGGLVTFTDASQGDPAEWEWSFPAGPVPSGDSRRPLAVWAVRPARRLVFPTNAPSSTP